MTSALFTKIGLAKLDIAYLFIALFVILIALIVIVVIQIVQNKKLKQKYDAFMQGSRAMSLENQIQKLAKDVNDLAITSDIHTQDIDTLFYKHQDALQKFALIKYDAFKESGGKLSYVLVVLDENNNGFIINSVHSSSTGCYSYSKKIVQGACDIELSKEESFALNKAINEVRN